MRFMSRSGRRELSDDDGVDFKLHQCHPSVLGNILVLHLQFDRFVVKYTLYSIFFIFEFNININIMNSIWSCEAYKI